jgi:putative spermidine/putrescine transport system ATP-binding protein
MRAGLPYAGGRGTDDVGRAAPTGASQGKRTTVSVSPGAPRQTAENRRMVHAAHSLTLRNVAKHYGPVRAVDDVTLTVPRGEFLTLLGPSGSGKTTILMMVAGFVAPTAGEILLDSRAITHLPPEKRNFGMVFQGYALFPHMSVFDNVAFPLTVRRRPAEEIRRRVAEVLELVRLGGLEARTPRQLSGGQQQRVALARALSFDPDILLLDEPLGALDRKLRTQVQVELKQVHRRVGTTFIYVTHDQEEALSLSDRVAIVRSGRVVQIGSPDELYERPATRFVADFLGESNFIKGTVAVLDPDGFSYRAGGGSFRQSAAAGPSSGLARGQPVLLALRPEKLALGETEPEAATNRIAGTIAECTYLGSTIHVAVATEALGTLAASIPAWRCGITPEAGRRVWVSWEPDASVVVDD